MTSIKNTIIASGIELFDFLFLLSLVAVAFLVIVTFYALYRASKTQSSNRVSPMQKFVDWIKQTFGSSSLQMSGEQATRNNKWDSGEAYKKERYFSTLPTRDDFREFAEYSHKKQDAFRIEVVNKLESIINDQKQIIQRLNRLEAAGKSYRQSSERRDHQQQNRYSVADARTTERGDSSRELPHQDNKTGAKINPPVSYDPQYKELCSFYNSLVDNPSRRREFRDRYKLARIGTCNVMERYKTPSIDPEFQIDPDGDFFAVELKGERRFAVVPYFGLVLKDDIFGPGAMGVVFDCPGYSNGCEYTNLKVNQPAIFASGTGQQWMLERRGVLDIGQGS